MQIQVWMEMIRGRIHLQIHKIAVMGSRQIVNQTAKHLVSQFLQKDLKKETPREILKEAVSVRRFFLPRDWVEADLSAIHSAPRNRSIAY